MSEQSVQTTNKAEAGLGPLPKKTSHTWTHTMGEEKKGKELQKTNRGGEKGEVWLHVDGTTHEYLRHKSLLVWPRTGVLLCRPRHRAVVEGALFPKRRWLGFPHTAKWVGHMHKSLIWTHANQFKDVLTTMASKSRTLLTFTLGAYVWAHVVCNEWPGSHLGV